MAAAVGIERAPITARAACALTRARPIAGLLLSCPGKLGFQPLALRCNRHSHSPLERASPRLVLLPLQRRCRMTFSRSWASFPPRSVSLHRLHVYFLTAYHLPHVSEFQRQALKASPLLSTGAGRRPVGYGLAACHDRGRTRAGPGHENGWSCCHSAHGAAAP